MSRHIGVTQRRMKEQARGFFSGMKTGNEMTEDLSVTDAERAAARKKLLSYKNPLKIEKEMVEKGDAFDLAVVEAINREEDTKAPSYREFPILRKKSSGFRSLIERHNLLKTNMEMLAREQATIRGEIQLLVELAGQKSVLMDAILVTRTEGRKPSEKIDRKKISRQLQKRGFTADDVAVIVNASIVKGKPGRPGVVITDTSKAKRKNAVAGE